MIFDVKIEVVSDGPYALVRCKYGVSYYIDLFSICAPNHFTNNIDGLFLFMIHNRKFLDLDCNSRLRIVGCDVV